MTYQINFPFPHSVFIFISHWIVPVKMKVFTELETRDPFLNLSINQLPTIQPKNKTKVFCFLNEIFFLVSSIPHFLFLPLLNYNLCKHNTIALRPSFPAFRWMYIQCMYVHTYTVRDWKNVKVLGTGDGKGTVSAFHIFSPKDSLMHRRYLLYRNVQLYHALWRVSFSLTQLPSRGKFRSGPIPLLFHINPRVTCNLTPKP
jgi:hypothetical protein